MSIESATLPCPEKASLPASVLHLFQRPRIAWQLHRRGVALRPDRGEGAAELENRLGTQLMALYRDTRTEESFAALYDFARPAVLMWIRSLLRRGLDHLDATDLLQDTFVNVYRYPSGFREDHDGSFRVWVRTIAGNIVRRARSRSGAVSLQELPEGVREPADTRSGPEALAVADEQSESLRSCWVLFLSLYHQAYADLSERDREALHLVEVEGLSYADAGARLRVGPSNMKMIIFRSRKRISARMRSALLRAGFPARAAAG